MPSSWSGLLALQQATHATLAALGHDLGDLALSPAELNLLASLSTGEQRTVSQLASDVGSRVTTVSGVLDRLERRGYVARKSHRTDRRALRIELTSSGRRIAARVRRSFDDLERRAFQDLSARAIADFRRALTALTEASAVTAT